MPVLRHRARRRRSIESAGLLCGSTRLAGIAALGVAAVLAGCATDGSTNRTNASVTSGTTDESAYLVEPVEALDIGYRVDWQANPALGPIDDLFIETDEAVLLLEDRNYLTRVQPENGHRLWRVPVARERTEVLGVTYVSDMNRVYVLTGGELLEFDGSTGNQLSRQQLRNIANTPPVLYGGTILYGARNGQLVWHSYPVGHMWKSYQLAPSIRVTPTIAQETVAVVGSAGGVYAMDAGNAQQLWSQSLLEPAVAPATVGNNAVFVAGTDQYVRAYELDTGRTIWSELTASPLRTSPVLIGDTIYQQVPGVGIVAYEAVPIDQFGGVRNWVLEDVGGTVITRTNGRLYAWNSDEKVLSVIDPQRGALIDQVHLPNVRQLTATDVNDGVLFALGQNNRLLRLTPVQ